MKKLSRAMTAEEFSLLPDRGTRQELVRGELEEMPPPQYRHGKTTANVEYVLNAWVRPRKLGRVVSEMGFLIERDPDTVLAPDCAFIRADRIPRPEPEGYFPLAPDLAVEVLSPSDRPGGVLAKVDLWRAAGTRLVWVVDPERREVRTFRPAAEPSVDREGDVLDGGDVLPGLAVPVADLFA
jgi:Uma2 family endonuclease